MRLPEIIDGIDGLRVTGGDVAVTGVTADSREIRAGFLFAALPSSLKNSAKGRDGRDFIAQAVAAGATAVLVPEGSKVDVPAHVAVIYAQNARAALAKIAANFHGAQPRTIVAVTGTNGKSSMVTFCRQLWKTLGIAGASLGTIGVTAHLTDGRTIDRPGALTTPDPVSLQKNLSELAADGVTHVAMEASSQGLDQYRMHGARVMAGAFTNLTRDHLDYHGDMQQYLEAKLKLFTEVVTPGGVAVINRDMPEYPQIAQAAQDRGLRILDVSADAKTKAAIVIREQRPLPHGQFLSVDILGQHYDLELPLVGDFQAMNAMMALALVVAENPDDVALRQRAVAALERLDSVRGRLELAATLPNGAAIYVDYAHTPDGLETMLRALRPHCHNKLHVVFGCGGDRDTGKRPQMGAIAANLADDAIVTDDNPRTEDAASIRDMVMAGVPAARANLVQNIGGRREAMREAISRLAPGDILVVAGKGHEQGQIVGTTVLPFDDVTEIKNIIQENQKTGGANHAPSQQSPVDNARDRRGPGRN